MKQVVVGTYYCGHEFVQLVLREGTGGEFFHTPEIGSVPRVKVGADQKAWWEVLGVLLHEIMEFQIDRHHARYSPTNDQSYDHCRYIFHVNHFQFSDCCANTGEFMAKALPDLQKAWKKWHRKPARRKRT